MERRYDQSDLNTYGAEDDEDMDAILRAIDRAIADEPSSDR
ncbi:hypothetical protein AB6N24_14975 [Cellulomonas sp. 179-A 4D5 NHS]